MPIISAAAVTAVRAGLRSAFSLASRPATAEALDAASRPRRERPHDVRREHRDADEDQQRAAAHAEQPRWRVEPSPEHAVATSSEAADGEERRDDGRVSEPDAPAAAPRPRAAPRSAAPGWRAAPGRAPRAASRRCRPASATMTVPRRERRARRPAARSRSRRTARRCPSATPRPATRPRIDASTPTTQRLADHAREHLPARSRRASAASPNSRDPLGDRDRERVEDDERADEHGDDAERQQRVPRKPMMSSATSVWSARCVLLAGLHLTRGRQRPARPRRAARVLRDAGLGRDVDRVDLPSRSNQLLAVGERARARVAPPIESRRRT